MTDAPVNRVIKTCVGESRSIEPGRTTRVVVEFAVDPQARFVVTIDKRDGTRIAGGEMAPDGCFVRDWLTARGVAEPSNSDDVFSTLELAKAMDRVRSYMREREAYIAGVEAQKHARALELAKAAANVEIDYGENNGVKAVFKKASREMVFTWAEGGDEKSARLFVDLVADVEGDKNSIGEQAVDLGRPMIPLEREFLLATKSKVSARQSRRISWGAGYNLTKRVSIPAKPEWVIEIIEAARLNR